MGETLQKIAATKCLSPPIFFNIVFDWGKMEQKGGNFINLPCLVQYFGGKGRTMEGT